ncbi:PBP domain containing protein [Asbolus verrucosus]|uniref:PBP domain containing protein n=1 Tax=Asbolus verrucosus TaxID=1661398 RepID=A0A482W2M9_ASBVE|nr:PBP domain containing protein [Asbolus verrucosus]
METDEIVPNILPEVPSAKITIIYPDDKRVELGQELTPHDVKSQPSVKWDSDPDKFYTLLMIDPDAPSRKYPFVGEFNHWLVGNIKECDLSTADIIAEYKGSFPPKYTGLHRYIFLVFEQKDKLTFEEKVAKDSRLQRMRFSVKKFMKKYEFEKVLAWNYFKAQWCAPEGSQETRTCVCM